MTDPSDLQDQAHVTSGQPISNAPPRWVKVLGFVILALIVLFVVLQLVTGGQHGPGRHLRSSGFLPSGIQISHST